MTHFLTRTGVKSGKFVLPLVQIHQKKIIVFNVVIGEVLLCKKRKFPVTGAPETYGKQIPVKWHVFHVL